MLAPPSSGRAGTRPGIWPCRSTRFALLLTITVDDADAVGDAALARPGGFLKLAARLQLRGAHHPQGLPRHPQIRRLQATLGIGRSILTRRLNTLVDEGVLRRVQYQPSPARYEYRLTDKGRDAFPILAALAAWGDRWLTGPEGTLLVLHHTRCEHDMSAVVVCSESDQPVDVRDVRAITGPGYRDERP